MTLFKKLPAAQDTTDSTKPYGILVVDDEADILDALSKMLIKVYRVETAISGDAGLKVLQDAKPDALHVIIADQRMPGMSGVEFLERARELFPKMRRIVLTGYTDFQAAVQSINLCKASSFLLKPFKRDELFATVERALQEYEMLNRKKKALSLNDIAGSQMRAFLETYSELPESDATVLVQGETGTGKELVARAIHDNSLRSALPFVTIHCGALPETLFETELFGHKRGSFTGAQQDRKGRVVQAHGGTLFIDEVAEIPLSVQAKLLRFFQSGEYQRVGSDEVAKVDVRIVAATHRNLPEMIEAGTFRQDLYYRLNVVSLTIPPLRERMGDLGELTTVFLRKYGKGAKSIDRQALMILGGYDFPGNVRELEHCIERACALSRIDEIGPHHLPSEVLQAYGSNRPAEEEFYTFTELTNEELKAARIGVTRGAVDRLERSFLKQLLARFESVAPAARHAGMARSYLHRLLSKHDVRGNEASGSAEPLARSIGDELNISSPERAEKD